MIQNQKILVNNLLKMSGACSKRGWWTRYSEDKLIKTENKILSVVKSTFKTWFVPIGSTVGNNDQIWTIVLNEEAKNTPLVLLHGFAAGIAFWCKNFDEIAKDRPVYAIDLLGFGRSSRPYFAKKCEDAEKQWIDSIEEWRKQVKLDNFILLGHSFGGYLATSYTISHPDRVKHLILADPWGFNEKPPNFESTLSFKLRFMSKLLLPLYYFNPLSSVRAAGPLGPRLVRYRRDIAHKYEDQLDDTDVIYEYIYQCNTQYPSGETAFSSFVKKWAFAKNPMMLRFDDIHKTVPITVMYGEKSWLSPEPGVVLKEKREGTSYMKLGIIPNAGHHIYSDEPEMFNEFVRATCKLADDDDTADMVNSVKLIWDIFDHDKIIELIKNKYKNKEATEEELEAEIDKKEVAAIVD